jgi:hypothetical protein
MKVAESYKMNGKMYLPALIAIFSAVFILSAVSADDLVLAEQGKSGYQIVVPDKSPNPVIEHSLNGVAHLVQAAFKANGADVPIVAEAVRDTNKPSIFLGNTIFAQEHGVNPSKLDGWSYVHKVVGRNIIVAGREQPSPGGERINPTTSSFDRLGTAKAVVDFLRLYAGTYILYPDTPIWRDLKESASVNWLESPTVEFLPVSVIKVPSSLNVYHKVPIKYNISYPSSAGFYDMAVSRFPIVDEVFGCHTYSRAIPPEKYKNEHPEYFALIQGKRLVDGDGQYCISNPDVQSLIYKDLIKWLDAGYETVDLGQPDGFQPCECEKCNKLFGTGNDWGEKLWILHRNLVERVLKDRPGKQVILMSYIQTGLPPKTFNKFPKNTRIMLTGTDEVDIMPWRACEVPGGFTAYIYNWCPNLSSRYTPMRTPRFVEAQAKRLISNNFLSIYRDGSGSLFGLEGPVYYTMGRMLDDAANNKAKDLVSEFCSAAFGKSAPLMLRFYDQLYHGIELYSEFLGTRCPAWAYINIYGGAPKYLEDPFQFLGFLYTPSLLASLEKDLAQAEKTADTEKVKTRLTLVRREFNYLKSLVRVIHLYHAYEIQPDLYSRDRLLDAIDARNAEIAAYFDKNGNPLPMAGWAFALFPTEGGHDLAHMRLAHDTYQGPFKDTCLNWDTKAIRRTPLPGANSLTVKPVAGKVTLDAPAWKNVPAAILGGLPQDAKPSRKTTVRMLYDKTRFYMLVECELPFDLKPKVMDDPAAKESIVVYITPSSGNDFSYRFTIAPHPKVKTDAARGFITDLMDPRYGKYDPNWNGDWTYDTKLEPDRNRWISMISVPYKTLAVQTPIPGMSWKANVGRIHIVKPNQVERSIWSSTTSTKDMEDRTAFGDIVFEAMPGTGIAQPQ